MAAIRKKCSKSLSVIDYIAREKVSSELYDYKKSVSSIEEFEEMKEKMEDLYSEILGEFDLDDSLTEDIFDDFVDDLFLRNAEKKESKEELITKPAFDNRHTDNGDIDDLFERLKSDTLITVICCKALCMRDNMMAVSTAI